MSVKRKTSVCNQHYSGDRLHRPRSRRACEHSTAGRALVKMGAGRCLQTSPKAPHTRPDHPSTTRGTGRAAFKGVTSSSGNQGQEWWGAYPRCCENHLAYIILFNHFNNTMKYCYPQIAVYLSEFTQIEKWHNSVLEINLLRCVCVCLSVGRETENPVCPNLFVSENPAVLEKHSPGL